MKKMTILLFNTLMCILVLTEVLSKPLVEVGSSVNPVRSGGIIPIHCLIRNLIVDQHDVAISRQQAISGRTKTTQVSWNKEILLSSDDRIFLAIRQVGDGSVVYFLSIIEATYEDKGIYSCLVKSNVGTIAEVAADSVNIDVLFFPDDLFPICNQPDKLKFNTGEEITLNCSSNAGNPLVSINWIHTDSSRVHTTPTQITQYGITYSVLQLKLSFKDSEMMFICQMTSEAFPERVKSCHVGPIYVSPLAMTPNRNDVLEPGVTPPLIHPKLPESETTLSSTDVHQYYTPRMGESVSSKCPDVCSILNSHVLYWILATCIACILAIIFIIVGTILLVKLCRLTDSKRMGPLYDCRTEEIYVDLDGRNSRRDANRVYMTLERPGKSVIVTNDMIEADAVYSPYMGTPIVPRIH